MSLLQHVLLTAPSATPQRYLLFLHGIYGTGTNWRTFARRVVAARPGWGAVLVDLRMHGGSQGTSGPHTLLSAARDLDTLAVPGRVVGILGHSFGGKVALRYVQEHRGDLDIAWIVDSMPGPRPTARGSEGVLGVLAALRHIGPRHRSREDFITQLESQGISRSLGQWLAMNLRPDQGEFLLQLDLDAMEALLQDYFLQDLWGVVESPPGRVRLHLCIGGKSDVFDEADRARAQRAAAGSSGRVQVHVLPEAGHFVHVDDPDGLFRRVVADLDAGPP